jgi:para-nitrobenzyl esterase
LNWLPIPTRYLFFKTKQAKISTNEMKKINTILMILNITMGLSGFAQDKGNPRVKTANGILEGSSANGIHTFFGIPYAEPPVGELRWEVPQPANNWTGIRKATSFGPRAMQKFIYTDMIFRSPGISEDCLYLNVWTPASASGAKLPVLVYFHGGGFNAGDGSEPRYDGTSTASKGVVVVTINYRMGIFGFFVHPELSKRSKTHVSGNYGLMDMTAALRWVKANIAAFGGDPAKVTIGGQSAGSIAVSLQMASPLAKGLFRAAIGQSGSMMGINKPIELKQAEALGSKFQQDAGKANLDELKNIPAEELLEISRKPGAVYFPVIIDGYFLPEQPVEIYTKGLQAGVPLLAGWTSAEVGYGAVTGKEKPTLENYNKALERLYGENAGDVKKVYVAANDEEALKAATELAGDRYLGFSTWKWIDIHGKTNGYPVYRYLYQQLLPAVKGKEDQYVKGIGAPHSSDIAYALGNLPLDKVYAYTPEDFRASAFMQGYFVNFIKTTDPNGAGLPKWPGLQSSIPKVMYIDGDSKSAPEKYQKRYLFMDQFYYK